MSNLLNSKGVGRELFKIFIPCAELEVKSRASPGNLIHMQHLSLLTVPFSLFSRKKLKLYESGVHVCTAMLGIALTPIALLP
jgi:hypothetical protein